MGWGVCRKVFWGGVSAAVIDLPLSGFRGDQGLERGLDFLTLDFRNAHRWGQVSRGNLV